MKMPRGNTKGEYKKIGQCVREMRQSIKMSQENLAKKLGVSFQQVQKYESGENRIPLVQFVQVCRLTDHSVQEIVDQLID